MDLPNSQVQLSPARITNRDLSSQVLLRTITTLSTVGFDAIDEKRHISSMKGRDANRPRRPLADNDPFARALIEADKARGRSSPNPPVGALIVKDSEVIAMGHTQPGGPRPRRDRGVETRRLRSPRRAHVRDFGALLHPGPHAALHRRNN